MSTLKEIKQATDYLRDRVDFKPEVGIILGTGLGALVEDIQMACIKPLKQKSVLKFKKNHKRLRQLLYKTILECTIRFPV